MCLCVRMLGILVEALTLILIKATIQTCVPENGRWEYSLQKNNGNGRRLWL